MLVKLLPLLTLIVLGASVEDIVDEEISIGDVEISGDDLDGSYFHHPYKKLPNLIFILGDDIGWNDVGWNNPNFSTPHMDKLGKEGVVLDQFYAMPLCTPSRATMLSGLYAQQLGLQRGVLGAQEPYGIPLRYNLLPKVLKRRGYSTHAMGKWHLGFCDWRYTPTYRGFDTFFGFYEGYEENYEHCLSPFFIYDPMTNCTQFDFRKNTRPAKEYNGVYSSYAQNDRAVEIIKNHKNSPQPLFMYVALSAAHFPTQGDKFTKQCEKEYKHRQEFCGAMIGIDEVVHNITEALKTNDMYNNSVIVFVSDNGGNMHFGGNNYPLRGNKGSLWEGGTRVPGFIHSPLLKETGYTYKGLFHMVDWYTTFLHLAKIRPSKTLFGVNQWNAVSENKEGPRKDFPYNMDILNGVKIGAVRVGDYKYINGDGGTTDGWYTEAETIDESYNSTYLVNYASGALGFNLTDQTPKLYNLVDDPSEKTNLADKEPEKLAELKKVFDYYFRIAKPAVKMPEDPAGNPDKFGGTFTPGWCRAYYHVPTDRKRYMDQHIIPVYAN